MSKTAEQRQDEIIVANIRYYMSRNKINQKQLAAKLGICETTMWSRMTVDTDMFTIAQLRRLANIFNVSGNPRHRTNRRGSERD